MPEIRAKYLITCADDFVIEAFWNGILVPESKRKLLRDIHGASVERMEIEVRAGDWLVFNVASNRMRWGGSCYFALAGCLEENQFGFASSDSDQHWWACDRAVNAESFISRRDAFLNQPAQKPETPWDQGGRRMRELAGDDWKGVPVWGRARNTWLKVLVD